jgi:hypothetical protein
MLGGRSFLSYFSVLLLACPIGSRSAQTPQLHEFLDGAQIELAGTIQLERIGNRTSIVLKTKDAYLALFDQGTHRRMVHEVEIMLAGQYEALKQHAGQSVSVSGVVQLNAESPYYFNGALIQAKSLRFPDGKVLLPVLDSVQPLPVTLERFYALVTFSPNSPNSSDFSYKARTTDGQLLPIGPRYLSCGLNGSGEILNCFCGEGFEATGQGRLEGERFVLKGRPDKEWPVANFELPEGLQHPISYAVECTRKAQKGVLF